MSSASNPQRGVPDDTKPRRSTKVSGKLKVLPEQPEPAPVPTKRALLAPAQSGEGENATGDSDDDDGDGGPDEDETEDVDVRFPYFCWVNAERMCSTWHRQNPQPHTSRSYMAGGPNRCITRLRECPQEPRVAMLYVSRRRKQSPFPA
jgi:hypothetical protein